MIIVGDTEFTLEWPGRREQCLEKIVDKEGRSFQIKMVIMGSLEIAIINKSPYFINWLMIAIYRNELTK